MAVDLGSALVCAAMLTGADIGDSLAADGLVQGEEAAVFMGDRRWAAGHTAYDRAPRRAALAEAGVTDGIMLRAHARRPLTAWQRWTNRTRTPTRALVERCFGTLKRSDGWQRVRSRGVARARAHLPLCSAPR